MARNLKQRIEALERYQPTETASERTKRQIAEVEQRVAGKLQLINRRERLRLKHDERRQLVANLRTEQALQFNVPLPPPSEEPAEDTPWLL